MRLRVLLELALLAAFVAGAVGVVPWYADMMSTFNQRLGE